HHLPYIGLSLKPATLSQLTPSSVETKRPGGDVPAHQTFGSLGWPGESQKVWLTARPFSACGKAGGLAASFHVLPLSVERKIVGPRWPVFAAISSVPEPRSS